MRSFKAAFNKRVLEFSFVPQNVQFYDVDLFLKHVEKEISLKLFSSLTQHYAVKFSLVLDVELEKYSLENQQTHLLNAFFHTENHLILTKNHIKKFCNLAIRELLSKYDNFLQHGSGWNLNFINKLILKIGRFKLFKAGCEKNVLPSDLQKSKGILKPQIKNNNLCFMISIILALTSKFKQKNKSRLNKFDYDLIKVLPFEKINFPVSIKDVQDFEKNINFAINIYGYEFEKLSSKKREIFPVYISNYIKSRKKNINLLLYDNHFYAIHNLSVLLQNKNKKSKRKTFVCNFCLATFENKKTFNQHSSLCNEKGFRYKLPEKPMFKEFSSWSNITNAPFVIYADFESSILKEEEFKKGKQVSFKPHQCISWASVTICRDNPDFNNAPKYYTGTNCVQIFLQHLEKEYNRIMQIIGTFNKPIKITPFVHQQFNKSEKCYICHYAFASMPSFYKQHDHNHLNGNYRGAICQTCNLKYAKPNEKIVVFFHGLCNYDSHFIVKQLYKYAECDLKVIPRTTEKYLSFSVKNIIFKDSYQFLSESLQVLANNLKDKGISYFQTLNTYVKDPTKKELLFRKGVFPYNYISSLEILNEKQLPPITSFFDDLTQTNISTDDYLFAQKIWLTFQCKTLKDYLHVYLLTDVLLLADVFENFRTNCLKDYELDPVHYFSGAHFTFDAFLLKSQESIELITDVNQYLMFQKMVRGGMSMVCKRYAYANNKMLKSFNPYDEEKYLLYIDANNLYGWAMTQNLPFANFTWCKIETKLVENIIQNTNLENKGYILEVDLEYPESLHDLHNDFPLAPEKLKISFNDLSPFAQKLCSQLNLKSNLNTSKLIPNLNNKDNYVLYYKNLQLYLKLGLKLKKVHKILQFDEKPIMKEYIEFNSKKRAESSNAFDISFYKFLSNSLFGKTMERPENKSQIKFINQIDTYEKYVSKLNFKQLKIIQPDLVSLQMTYPVFKVLKPFYIGAVILELAKYLMYDFHYNIMKKHFKNNIELIYTDTDSFFYEIKTKNIYADLEQLKHHFDFSNYDKNHFLFSTKNKKVPGFFKDECPNNSIIEFIGLKSKMYSFVTEDNSVIKHAKGVKTSVINQDLKFESFLDCLFDLEILSNNFRTIRSVAHSVFTSHQIKNSLSPFDDKRWLFDSLHSLAYGHFKIKKNMLQEEKDRKEIINNNMAFRKRNWYSSRMLPALYREKVSLADPSDITIEVIERDRETRLWIKSAVRKGFISLQPYELDEIVQNFPLILELINACEEKIKEDTLEEIDRLNKKPKKEKTAVLTKGNLRKKIEEELGTEQTEEEPEVEEVEVDNDTK